MNEHRLLAGEILGNLHECRAITKSLEISPGLLDRRLFGKVLQYIDFVDIAGIAEGNELRNPSIIVSACQLVQDSRGNRSALRENSYRSKAWLRQTTYNVAEQQQLFVSYKEGVDMVRIVHSHTVGTEHTTTILMCQTDKLLLHGK